MFKTKFICVGEIDLEILSELHSRHPGAWLDNEVVEPSAQQLHDYKGKDTGLICVDCFPKALLFFLIFLLVQLFTRVSFVSTVPLGSRAAPLFSAAFGVQ